MRKRDSTKEDYWAAEINEARKQLNRAAKFYGSQVRDREVISRQDAADKEREAADAEYGIMRGLRPEPTRPRRRRRRRRAQGARKVKP